MKRFLIFAVAGLLLALGCQREAMEVPQDGGLVTANISVSLPAGMDTKAPGQGALVKELLLRVYDAKGKHIPEMDLKKEVSGQTISFDVRLLRSHGYKLVFWAQAKDQYTIGEDQNGHPVISIPATELPDMMNEDAYDAFYAVKVIEKQNKDFNLEVSLTRPFAQLNLGISQEDMVGGSANFDLESFFQTSFAIVGVPSSLDLFTGEVSGETDVTYNYKDVPAHSFTLNQKSYHCIGMVYVLAPIGGTLHNTTLNAKAQQKVGGDKWEFSRQIKSVPLKRNSRTSIVGNVFTVSTSFSVQVEADFGTSDTEVMLADHEFVDLGHPYLVWATCNVGASKPEEYGNYYAWGETSTKEYFDWDTYKWMENGYSISSHITKYTFADGGITCIWYSGDTFIGDNGDGVEHKDLASYDYADDAARQNWGGNWRIPTDTEFIWLRTNCTWVWQDNYEGTGVSGWLATSLVPGFENSSIFLPTAGCRFEDELLDEGDYGVLWFSTLSNNFSECAQRVYYGKDGLTMDYGGRRFGQSIRPVKLREYESVDLGLPSGLKWASFNLGATRPEEYGDYFAWGETETKESYYWGSYKWRTDGEYDLLTRYCTLDKSNYWGGEGEPDGKTEFKDYDYADDAARKILGGKWRIPTNEEWKELMDNCTSSWTTQNNVNGFLFTATNGNSIFLPAAGSRSASGLSDDGLSGYYWSSSLSTDFPDFAWCVFFYSDYSDVFDRSYECRYFGQSIRPVTE